MKLISSNYFVTAVCSYLLIAVGIAASVALVQDDPHDNNNNNNNYLQVNESTDARSFRAVLHDKLQKATVVHRSVVLNSNNANNNPNTYPEFEYDPNNYTDEDSPVDEGFEDEDDDEEDDDEESNEDDQHNLPSVHHAGGSQVTMDNTIDLDNIHRSMRVQEYVDFHHASNNNQHHQNNHSRSRNDSFLSTDILLNDQLDLAQIARSGAVDSPDDSLSNFRLRIISKFIICSIYLIICLSCVLGNILVILSVFTYRPLQSVQNIFIVSLALADALVAVFVMPFHIIYHITDGKWLFGTILCHFFLLLDILLCTASTLHLCCIALDRYWAIKDSIRYAQKRTMKRVLVMIFIAWFSSLVISLPVVIWNTKTVRSDSSSSEIVCDIPTDKLYRFYSSSGTFFMPLFVMTFVYVRIYMETKRRLRERARTAQKLANTMTKSNKTVKSSSRGGGAGAGAGSPDDRSLDGTSSVLSFKYRCLTRFCPDLIARVVMKNASSSHAGISAGAKKVKPGLVKMEKKKPKTIKKAVIINEINGDTGEKIGTHHQRIQSNQDSSFALRDLSYASLNRSPLESEENASPPSDIANRSPPHSNSNNNNNNKDINTLPVTKNNHSPTNTIGSNGSVANNNLIPNSSGAIPTFQLEVEEPTRLPEPDDSVGEDAVSFKSDSVKVEKRSVGTYTKSRKSSKLSPSPNNINNNYNEDSNLLNTVETTKTTLNTMSSGGSNEDAPAIVTSSVAKKNSTLAFIRPNTSNNNNNNNAAHASSWIKENAGAGVTLKERQKISLTRERRAARTLGIIMGAFTLCWMPFFVLYLLQSFHLFLESPHLFEFLTWLGYVNSALNPVIYTIFNLDFRKSFERLLFKCFSCQRR